MEPQPTENPYSPPKIEVEESILKALEIPKKTKGKIVAAFVMGLISGSATLLFTLLGMFGVYTALGFDVWSFVDVVLIYGLAIGIFFKSRTCAIAMTAYFVYSKIYMAIEFQQFNGVAVSVAFLVAYIFGIVGTFEYHRLKRQFLADRRAAAESTPVL